MSRPLDFIKELADLPYKVTTKPIFYANGRIRSVIGKIFERKGLIDFVNATCHNLYVMECNVMEGEKGSNYAFTKRSTAAKYHIRYCIVEPSKHSLICPYIEQ